MSLYRKYRPQNFDDLIGQDHVKKTLTNAIKNGRIGHAYLLTGPRGVGKTTVARLIAKSLNCTNRKGAEPCNECSSCKEILADNSLDVMEIDAASNRGIDDIRDLREKIKFAPSTGKYKVFIIDEVHMLSKDAFNALLKTLEEPPKHAIFIMATTEIQKIPATILSRVQQFDFKRARLDNIVKYLDGISKKEGIVIEDNALRTIAFHGDGSYRDATSVLDQVVSLGYDKITLIDVQEILGLSEEKTVYEFAESILNKDIKNGYSIINNLFIDGYDLHEFNRKLIDFFRKLLIYKSNKNFFDNMELTKEQINSIENIGRALSVQEIIRIINILIEVNKDIKGASIPQLPLEMALTEICGLVEDSIKLKPNNDEMIKQVSPKEVIGSEKINDTQSVNQVIDKEDTSKIAKENDKIVSDSSKNPEMVETKKDVPEKEKTNEGDLKTNKTVPVKIQESWENVLNEIEPNNKSLYLILKDSKPQEIKNDKLILGVKFKFYIERIENKKNSAILSEAFEKICGEKYIVACILDEKLAVNDNVEEETIQVVESINSQSSKKDNPKEDSSHLINDAMNMFN